MFLTVCWGLGITRPPPTNHQLNKYSTDDPHSANRKPLETRAFREFIIPLKKAPLLPLSLYLFLFLFLFLHNFTSFSLEKKEFLPGLIAACYELISNAPSSLQFLTPSSLNTFKLFTILFLPVHTRYSHLAGISSGNF